MTSKRTCDSCRRERPLSLVRENATGKLYAVCGACRAKLLALVGYQRADR